MTNLDNEDKCRVCYGTRDQLDRQNTPLYVDIVCDCKGSMGAICHQCLQRLVLNYHEEHCMHCRQRYSNVEIIYERQAIEILCQLIHKFIVRYVLLRAIIFAVIAIYLNMRLTILVCMVLAYLGFRRRSQPEPKAIRVVQQPTGWWPVM
ncbi:uncharacterized protein LOC128955349 [Oppia nitens]|uniref:uncharacterized protein LOC128955349 n=1 Tax=Oppia nitens TaxID=1686743 RepID=UPI0023DC634E|nr:uncharacterized protein LOC128955349 [Oppia nitens]